MPLPHNEKTSIKPPLREGAFFVVSIGVID